VNVILRRIGRIIGCPVHHRQGAALKRHQIEEAAALLEGEPMLYLDQPSGSLTIFEHSFFDLHRSI
jgi:hypothetical protein